VTSPGGGGAVGKGREGKGKSRFVCGEKPVLVLVMYWLRASTRGRSFQIGRSSSKLVTSLDKRSWAQEEVGKWKIACWKDSRPILHWWQVSSGFSSNQEGWVLGVACKVTYDTGLGLMLEWFYRWKILSRKARSKV